MLGAISDAHCVQRLTLRCQALQIITSSAYLLLIVHLRSVAFIVASIPKPLLAKSDNI